MRDSFIRTFVIGAALAVIAVAAETTATAQQSTAGTPQLPAAASQPPANDRALRVTPFLVMGDDYAPGAGVQRDEFHVRTLSAPPTVVKRTEFAIGIGGGASVPIGSRWSYRADFRWYDPKAEWPESWCVYNGITLHLMPR